MCVAVTAVARAHTEAHARTCSTSSSAQPHSAHTHPTPRSDCFVRWNLAQARAQSAREAVEAELRAGLEAQRVEGELVLAGERVRNDLRTRLTEGRSQVEALDAELIRQEGLTLRWQARLRVVGESIIKRCPACQVAVTAATTGAQHHLACLPLQNLRIDFPQGKFCRFHVFHSPAQEGATLLCRGGET